MRLQICADPPRTNRPHHPPRSPTPPRKARIQIQASKAAGAGLVAPRDQGSECHQRTRGAPAPARRRRGREMGEPRGEIEAAAAVSTRNLSLFTPSKFHLAAAGAAGAAGGVGRKATSTSACALARARVGDRCRGGSAVGPAEIAGSGAAPRAASSGAGRADKCRGGRRGWGR
ncbi:hypothetical protein ABZP36_014701 [Zizania latifolia]